MGYIGEGRGDGNGDGKGDAWDTDWTFFLGVIVCDDTFELDILLSSLFCWFWLFEFDFKGDDVSLFFGDFLWLFFFFIFSNENKY